MYDEQRRINYFFSKLQSWNEYNQDQVLAERKLGVYLLSLVKEYKIDELDLSKPITEFDYKSGKMKTTIQIIDADKKTSTFDVFRGDSLYLSSKKRFRSPCNKFFKWHFDGVKFNRKEPYPEDWDLINWEEGEPA